MYLSKHKKENNLLRLYKKISESQEPTDDSVFKKDNDKKFVSQFAKNKNALYVLILDALHQFHLKKSPYARVLTLLHQAEILSNKGLIDDQRELLEKAGGLADDYDLPELKLEVLKLENNAIATKDISKNILKETKHLSDEIVQRSKLMHLTQHLLVFTRIAGNRLTLKQIRYLKEHGLRELKGLQLKSNSFFIQYSYLDYFLMYHTIIGNTYESYINGMKIFKLVKQNPTMLRLQIWRDKYGSSLNRLLNASAMVSKNKLTEIVYNEINKLDIADYRKFLVELNILDIYIQSGEFKMGENSLKSIQNNTMHIKRGLDPYTISILYFNLALMNFGLENYTQANFWFNEIIKNSDRYVPDRYFGGVTLILRLITYYELKQYDMIESRLRSAHQFIMKKEFGFKFDQIMLSYIRQIVAINNKQDLMTITKKVRSELFVLLKDKTEAKILYYFDFISWLDSKIENRPFAEIVKRKALGRLVG